MRAGVAALQHTLTLQAAVVLRNAVADARRRGHSQVQPLHVAAMLLACPGSPLRRACIQSHPYTASHPLQCRALELCFNVALERLPASGPIAAGMQSPGLSNALVAALKRAQAQQRRGCPEQQQQPLLAVRVEMEHLVISILDDPSVSRVMREAGFDSTHVKCNMEEAAACSTPPASASSNNTDPLSIRLSGGASQLCGGSPFQPVQPAKHLQRQVTDLYGGGSHLQGATHGGGHAYRKNARPGMLELGLDDLGPTFSRAKDIQCILQILLRPERCNPILIGDSTQSLSSLVQELAQRIERGNVPWQMQGVQFLSLKFASLASGACSRKSIDAKLSELRKLLDRCMPAGAILYLGDLEWLVETSSQGLMAFCPVRHATSEVGRLLLLYGSHRVWLIGTASPQTYLKCQAQHPLLANQWQLQPVRLSHSTARNDDWLGNLNSEGVHWKPPIQNDTATGPTADEGTDSWNCCPRCLVNCEQEQSLLHEQETTKSQLESAQSSSSSMRGEKHVGSPSLVQAGSCWHKPSQNNKDDEVMSELRRKWQQTCRSLHCQKPGAQDLMHTEVIPEPSTSSSRSYAETPDLNKCGIQISAKRQHVPPGFPRVDSLSTIPGNHIASDESPGVKPATMDSQQLDLWDSISEERIAGAESLGRPEVQGCNRKGSRSSLWKPVPCSVQTDLALGRPPASHLALGVVSQTDLTLGTPQAPLLKLAPSRQNAVGELSNSRMQMHNERLQDVHGCSSSLTQTHVSSEANPRLSFSTRSSIVLMPTSETIRSNSAGECAPEILTKFDADNFKVVCQELANRIPWQAEAIKVITNVVWDRRLCMGRRRGPTAKSSVWLLLLGPDKVGKREVAKGLARLVFGSEKNFICTSFHPLHQGLIGEGVDGMRHRGKTCLDRLVHAVRQKPFSVLLLEDIDQADTLTRVSLVRAMERGRLSDSNNREASFANVVVFMTSSLGTEFLLSNDSGSQGELSDFIVPSKAGMKLLVGEADQDRAVLDGHAGVAVICQNRMSHHDNISRQVWLNLKRKPADGNVPWSSCKRRRTSTSERHIPFDLNLSAEENNEEDASEDGCNTVFASSQPHRLEQQVIDNIISSAHRILPSNFCSSVDEIVIFHPVGLHDTLGSVLKKLHSSSSRLVDLGAFLEVELGVVEQMAVARLQTSGGDEAFKCWVLDVLDKSVAQLICKRGDISGKVVKLVVGEQTDYVNRIPLPSAIQVG